MSSPGDGAGDPRYPYQDLAQQQPPPSFADGLTGSFPAPAPTYEAGVPAGQIPAGSPPPGGTGHVQPSPDQPTPGQLTFGPGAYSNAPQAQAPAVPSAVPEGERGRRGWVVFIGGLAAFLAIVGIWTFLNRAPSSSSSAPADGWVSETGYQFETDRWLWEIREVDMDASGWLSEKYVFSAPETGEKPVAIRVSVTNRGSEPSDPFFAFDYVLNGPGGGGTTYYSENLIFTSEMMVGLGEVKPGKSAAAWIAFTVPADFDAGTLTVTEVQGLFPKEKQFEIP